MDELNIEDECECPPWFKELMRIDLLNLPEMEMTDIAELIVRSTEGLTTGIVQHDDKVAMIAFIAILRDFAMELERNYSETESDNGISHIYLN